MSRGRARRRRVRIDPEPGAVDQPAHRHGDRTRAAEGSHALRGSPVAAASRRIGWPFRFTVVVLRDFQPSRHGAMGE